MAMLAPILVVCLLLLLSSLVLADWIARRLLYPPRRPVTYTPRDYGLTYDDVAFPSTDGLILKGWWIPAEPLAGQQAPTVLLLHPMFGNRLGHGGQQGSRLGIRQPKVDLLKLAVRFHQAHYAVLLFDFRGHGESPSGLCAGGPTEDQDVVGAVDYVVTQAAADTPRVGVVGFGLGAAAALVAVGHFKGGTETMWVFSGDSEGGSDWTKVPPANIKRLGFLVAVQPVSLGTLLRGSLRQVSGPLGDLLVALVNQLCLWRGGYPLDPAALLKFARGVTVPVLYVQSRSYPWADCREVQALYDATPAPKHIWWLDAPPGGAETDADLDAHLDRVLAFAEQARTPP